MSSAPPPPPSYPPPPPGGWPGGPPAPPGGRRTPWGLVVAVVLAVLVLAAGTVTAVVLLRSGGDEAAASTSTSSSTAPSTSAPVSPPSSSPTASAPTLTAPPPVDTSAVVGRWQGTYTCAQGATGLSLEIRATSDTALEATFHFRKIPQNPTVPEGSYTMKGFLVNDKLRLRRQEWIDRPQGFVMVGLNARVTDPEPQRLSGTVSNLGCEGFTITRR